MRERNNPAPTPSEDGTTLHIPIWYDTGFSFLRRECLDADDPEHIYNFLKRHGYTPEHWGVEHPDVLLIAQEYEHKSREELLADLIRMRKELDAIHKGGF